MKKKGFDIEVKRILLFLGITFSITYLLEIGVIARLIRSGDDYMSAIGQILIAAVMLIPAVGVVLTRLITREGFKNNWIRPNIKGKVKIYLFAWFGSVVLTIVGAAVYFLINPGDFTLSMEYLTTVYAERQIAIDANQLRITMIMQVVIGILFAPLLNAFNCFGEEWGWRGYLLPKMNERFRMLPMLLINGVIWGLWHAPLTALGHNYGLDYPGYPFTGILAMCLFCVVMGTIFSYLSLKTKSCIPAVFAHGSLNGFAAFAIYFTKDGGNPFLGPTPTGIIGGSAFIVTALILAHMLIREERNGGETVQLREE